MCGIGGILRVYPAGAEVPAAEHSIPEGWLDVLDESIKHRGPDGQGRFRDRAVRGDGSVVDVALVHRRLSIIDHGGGHQPMVSTEGRPGKGEGLVAVVFNGCIYNHRVLRKELEGAGHRFVTDHSDTEVLVHGWREWGEELPARLDGMFALAIWDRGSGELFVARDGCGEKPLYETTEQSRGYIFASTAAGVARCVRLSSVAADAFDAVEGPALSQWVRFGCWVVPPLKAVDECDVRVASRYRLVDRGDGVLVNAAERWWYRDLPERRDRPLDVAGLEAMLARAVASRLEADVPLGCFLSGGVDSSLIAVLAQRELGRLRTYSVRMPDPRYDESIYAERVAGILKTDHETLDCEARPAEDLVRLIEQLGLPFGDSSLLPAHWVSAAARRHVTVALSGDGGDELFGGYERHVAARWLSRHRRVLALVPAAVRGAAHPRSVRSKLARLGGAARGGYDELLAIFGAAELRGLLGEGAGGPFTQRHHVADPLRRDFEHYLRDDLLRKSDAASMAVGLEVRAPFLACEVVDAALAAPIGCLMPGGKRKGLLRQVARKYLPAEIIDRPKMGFAIPVSEWFRSDYGGMKTLLMDRLRSVEPFGPASLGIELNMRFVDRMIEEHMGGRRDHGQRLYMLLVLSIWADWVGRVGK